LKVTARLKKTDQLKNRALVYPVAVVEKVPEQLLSYDTEFTTSVPISYGFGLGPTRLSDF
jgi:hypothetical protein